MRIVGDDSEIVVSVTTDELRLLSSAIGEALEAVEPWEFSSRLGAEAEEALALRVAIDEVLRQTFRPE